MKKGAGDNDAQRAALQAEEQDRPSSVGFGRDFLQLLDYVFRQALLRSRVRKAKSLAAVLCLETKTCHCLGFLASVAAGSLPAPCRME